MARRFGYWFLAWALVPLIGCAPGGIWRGSFLTQNPDKSELVAFWDRQFQKPAPTTAPPSTALCGDVHETRILATKDAGPTRTPASPAKEPDAPPPLLPTSAIEASTQESRPPLEPTPAQTTPVADSPGKREPLVDALQCIIEERHHDALKHLQKYDQATQEVFLRLLPVLALMTHKSIDQLSVPEVAVLHEQLQSLAITLRPRSKLAIDKICFCEWVKAYGIYKPLPENHAFVGSAPNRPGELVQLYVELRNFASEFKGGYHTTRLASTVEIRDQKGDRVWFYRFADGKQPLRSHTLLHDYFNNYRFSVPPMPAGTYTLTIQVTDETRPDQPRTAAKSLEFRVTSVSARVP